MTRTRNVIYVPGPWPARRPRTIPGVPGGLLLAIIAAGGYAAWTTPARPARPPAPHQVIIHQVTTRVVHDPPVLSGWQVVIIVVVVAVFTVGGLSVWRHRS